MKKRIVNIHYHKLSSINNLLLSEFLALSYYCNLISKT